MKTRQQFLQDSLKQGLGILTSSGSLVVQTGKHTGRSTAERFVVRRPETENTIDWGTVNQPVPYDFSQTVFETLAKKFEAADHYEVNAFVSGFPIQVMTTSPWHASFAQNMFREKPVASLEDLIRAGNGFSEPERIRIYHRPYDTTHSLGFKWPTETLLILDPYEMKVAIIGTAYAGEIKKSAFTICNYRLPEWNVFPMHASANCLKDGSRSSVLFGLSGTGKTTLSASAERSLIGDDEIVWSSTGISNLEGGCYAKLIDLDPVKEPEIYEAVHQPTAILENVVYHSTESKIDFMDKSKTENTRGSYPLSALKNVFDQSREAQPPKTIVFLTADAFGAMPAVAKLDLWQAQYHFISGYTAKVAGTEMGVKEPKAAFSTCFGAPFMPRHPSVYAQLLASAMQKSGATVWLLNTGWMKGYGKSDRFPIPVSRKILSAIQSGELNSAKFVKHPIFGFEVPTSCPGVDAEYLAMPEGPGVQEVARLFIENMKKFQGRVDPEVIAHGAPQIFH